ncbi:TVP38/TMEM64 family protein [Paenibacillus sp. R14(2021)]|uniref:TVP38/TMEM64 family protein n=1 Tax=Paenibacillus sp. R14(2021) TaxID=2859228 RepID=UPI001C61525D|nr:TVP38/TMEM64 family protein [Paenibacillus sp. R14(2021)]
MSRLIDWLSSLDEAKLQELLQRYEQLGPLPGIALTFMKSFVPPLPTIVIVGGNAAAYGLWLGFLYSWIGLVAGCMLTFLIVRRIGSSRWVDRWSRKPAVRRSMGWIRRNAFGYVFVLSLFPVGPFVVINVAAALARMRLRSFLIAVSLGKAIMAFSVSLIGHDVTRFMERPAELLYVAAFVAVSFWLCKKVEAKFMQEPATEEVEQPS